MRENAGSTTCPLPGVTHLTAGRVPFETKPRDGRAQRQATKNLILREGELYPCTGPLRMGGSLHAPCADA